MWQRKLRYCEHLYDVGLEYVFHCVEVDLCEVAAHVLRRGVVDEDVDVSISAFHLVPCLLPIVRREERFIPLNMFIHSPLAHLAVSQIPRKQETTPSFLLD